MSGAGRSQPPTLSQHGGHRPADAWRVVQLLLRHTLVTERHEPKGWRCLRCHPPLQPLHLTGRDPAGKGREG